MLNLNNYQAYTLVIKAYMSVEILREKPNNVGQIKSISQHNFLTDRKIVNSCSVFLIKQLK